MASSKRPCSWRMKPSSPAYHQSLPYAGAARSTIAQASSGTSVTPANAIVGTATDNSRASARVGLEVADDLGRVAAQVGEHRVHVAALAGGGAGRMPLRVAHPAGDVDLDAQVVAHQGQRGVAEGEGRVEHDRGRERRLGSGPQAEDVVEPAVIGRGRFRGRREAQPVPVSTIHESRVSDVS